jgi:hypothetical protein
MSAQCLHQRTRRLGREADHVNHHIGLARSDPLPKRPGRIIGRAIHLDLLDLRPRLVVDVWSADAAGQVDHLVAGAYQPRNQKAAHMSTAADHHDAHDS